MNPKEAFLKNVILNCFPRSKLCITHLLKNENPHILNLSPPLNLNPIWLKNHTGKKGFIHCLCVLNPTLIQTAAMDMLGGADMGKQCRNVDIMSDAAYAVLSKPPSYTGNFVIDKEILKTEGIKDFEIYAIAPGNPLLPDFFLAEELMQNMGDQVVITVLESDKPSAAWASSGPIAETFNIIKGVLNPDIVKSTGGVYKFHLSGKICVFSFNPDII
ncbi:unnamed protein product [Coregonus sp. 'balchen']|nr:unnamed protein product [Coregonus sp. 'balchen']